MRDTARRALRFPLRDALTSFDAGREPQAVSAAEDLCAAADEDAEAEPTRIELEHELTSLRVENALQELKIADLERDKAELRADVGRDRMTTDLHHALRREFADVATGSFEAGDVSWNLEDELADVLLRSANALRPREIEDPATGTMLPNPDTLDWPTLRATLGDGTIRAVGQALPGLLRDLALAPTVRTSRGCCYGRPRESLDVTLTYHGYSGGQVITTSTLVVQDDDDPRAESAARANRLAELRCRAAIESLVGLRLYDADE